MRNSRGQDPQSIEDLIRQTEDLLEPSGEVIRTQDDDIDLAQFTPAGTEVDEGAVYQNFSSGYGSNFRNAANQYAGDSAPLSGQQPGIRVYNPDLQTPPVRDEYRDYGGEPPRKVPRPKKRKKKGGCCGCGCGVFAALAVALAVGLVVLMNSIFVMPRSEESLGPRKDDTAAILLCGTDKDGTRTDTMMLVYLDGAENRVGLLSLPRDTLTITGEGKRAKLNSAYGRNGCGEEGMEWTLNYVQDIIGFRPDGYILVDMQLVPKIVDLMGGVDVHLDHHIRVHTDGVEVYVPAGDQHLNGEEVLATLRYRAGYANADLGRVQVQRMVITECMKQWVSPAKLALLPQALDLIQEESLTDMTVSNYLWIGKTILLGMGDMTSDTLPGYADMRGGASYFILYRDQVAELVNASYNPYTVNVDADDLDIAE